MRHFKTVGQPLALALTLGLSFVGCAPQTEATRELTPYSEATSAIPVPDEQTSAVPVPDEQTSAVPVPDEPASAVPVPDEPASAPAATTSEPTFVVKVSQCKSPSVASSLEIDAAFETEHLNADTTPRIAVLEYLITEIDPEYTCGTLFQQTSPGRIRSVRVYKLSEGAQPYAKLKGPLESALKDVGLLSKSSIVVLADFQGLLPQALIKSGWGSDEVIVQESLLATDRILYTHLADSNQSTFTSAVSLSKADGDRYNCSDFTSQAAAQAFFGGLADDVNRLDADNDGLACEAIDNISGLYKITLASVPTAAPVATVTPSPAPTYKAPTRSSSSKRCYVSGYTRKNGTRVNGYYRRC